MATRVVHILLIGSLKGEPDINKLSKPIWMHFSLPSSFRTPAILDKFNSLGLSDIGRKFKLKALYAIFWASADPMVSAQSL